LIFDKQNLMKTPKQHPINLRKEITIWGIDFHQTSFSDSGLLEVIDFLNSPEKKKSSVVYRNSSLNEDRSKVVYHLGLSDFLIHFPNKWAREKYRKKLCTLPMEEHGYQIPEMRGYFDYEWEEYLLVWALKDFELDGWKDGFWYGNVVFDIEGFTQFYSVLKWTKAWAEVIIHEQKT